MRSQIRAICFLTVLCFPLWWHSAVPVTAQSQGIIWSRPLNLSNSPPLSTHPAIVTDDYGYVHVFWSEEVGGRARQPGDLGGEGNSILYTRWDGTSWSQPTDILLVPGEGIAEFVAVDIDAEHMLHAVWTGQSNFYYSNAPSWQADSAHAWRKPIVIATGSARSRSESDILVDDSGTLHIVYATRGNEPGIYHTRSSDGGETWGLAGRLSEPLHSLEEGFSGARIIADGAGRLHAVWQTSQDEGYGQAVYYARSTDGGESWNAPAQLAYRGPNDTWMDWPYIMAHGESELHLIYVDGTNQGRAHRISMDGGETWSEPYHVIAEMEGINGYVIPLVDGSEQLHMVVNMRSRADQVVGVYYTRWLGDSWAPAMPVDVLSTAAPSAHYAAAAVRLGNEIHIVYNQISVGEIWHVRGLLPDVHPAPAWVLPQSQTPLPATPAIAAATDMPALPSETPSVDLVASPPAMPSLLGVYLPGAGVVLLLVVGVILWTRLRSR